MKNNTIKSWAPDDRPRERFLLSGKNSLSVTDLIAILLRTGTGKISVMDLARRVYENSDNSLLKLSRRSVSELMRIDGIGETKAISILAALELGNRKNTENISDQEKITSSRTAFRHMQTLLSDLQHEEFWLLLLDRSNKIITRKLLSRGGVSGTVVDPKLVFKMAVDHIASGMILFHNHPSGNLKPSESDMRLTSKLRSCGELLEIAVLDHIIVAGQNYFSFSDEGIM
jgi:DNA repair protein RadC